MFFVDANVLIYSLDQNSGTKADQAKAILGELSRRKLVALNLQVLNETTNVLLKKRKDLLPAAIREIVWGLSVFGDDPLDWTTISLGWEIRETTGYHWWDCLLLASASLKQCRYFISEDMQHERTVLDVTIINPFVTSPLDLPLPN